MPVHGIHFTQQGFELWIHENVKGRMSNRSKLPPECLRQWSVSYNPFFAGWLRRMCGDIYFWNPWTGDFFHDESRWRRYQWHGRIWWFDSETERAFWEDTARVL